MEPRIQCCGSGSVPFLHLDPGSGMGKKSRSVSGMNIPDHISESLETIFLVKKFLNVDPESFLPWIRDGKIRNRDTHPGSTTLRGSFTFPSLKNIFRTDVLKSVVGCGIAKWECVVA
jgi:hypothetical protein